MLYNFQAVHRLDGVAGASSAVLDLAIQEEHRWFGCVNQAIGHPGRCHWGILVLVCTVHSRRTFFEMFVIC